MKVVFRVDASLHIGSGHVMRCLTLAEGLRDRGAEILFLSRELKGHLCTLIQEKGFDVCPLPVPDSAPEALNWNAHAPLLEVLWLKDVEDATIALHKHETIDWLVVDHYSLDSRWEKRLRSIVGNIMVIDDLADRNHDCDLLLDQNYYPNMERRYDNLVSDSCQKLLGPAYALLRKEFREERASLRERNGEIDRLLVFFGGVDTTNETKKTLLAIQRLGNSELEIDVVVGKKNPHIDEIRAFCLHLPNCHFYCQVDNMAELMARTDLSIGATGASSWERCSLSLPTIAISVAYNQIEIAKAIAELGAIEYIGHCEEVSVEKIESSLGVLFNNSTVMKKMSERAGTLVDGEGLDRVSAMLEKV